MRKKIYSILIVIAIFFSLYVSSYIAIKKFRPEFINSNDGPIKAYQVLFYPLRHFDSNAPSYHKKLTYKTKIIAKLDWVNKGNGYTYFIHEGAEYRASSGANDEEFLEEEKVLIEICYVLETYDDYQNHLRPYIKKIKPYKTNGSN